MYRFVAWEVTTITIDSIAMQSHGTKFFEGPDFIFFDSLSAEEKATRSRLWTGMG